MGTDKGPGISSVPSVKSVVHSGLSSALRPPPSALPLPASCCAGVRRCPMSAASQQIFIEVTPRRKSRSDQPRITPMGTDKGVARYFISAIREIRGLSRSYFRPPPSAVHPAPSSKTVCLTSASSVESRSLRELVTPYKTLATHPSTLSRGVARYFISVIREIRGLDREAFLIQDQADRERQDEPCDRNDGRVTPRQCRNLREVHGRGDAGSRSRKSVDSVRKLHLRRLMGFDFDG